VDDQHEKEETEEPQASPPEERGIETIVFRWITLILTTTGTLSLGAFIVYLALQPKSWLIPIIKQHFAALFGIPTAAMIALAVVMLLKISAGPLEFEALRIKVKGAAGELLFWSSVFSPSSLLLECSGDRGLLEPLPRPDALSRPSADVVWPLVSAYAST